MASCCGTHAHECTGQPHEHRPIWWKTALLWLGFLGWCALVVSYADTDRHEDQPCTTEEVVNQWQN